MGQNVPWKTNWLKQDWKSLEIGFEFIVLHMLSRLLFGLLTY